MLAAVLFTAFQCYQAFTAADNFTTDQIIEVLSGTPGYVLGAAILLLAVPCALAASMLQDGKPAGRFLSMGVAVVGLIGLVTTVHSVLALKLAFSDEVARHCQ